MAKINFQKLTKVLINGNTVKQMRLLFSCWDIDQVLYLFGQSKVEIEVAEGVKSPLSIQVKLDPDINDKIKCSNYC